MLLRPLGELTVLTRPLAGLRVLLRGGSAPGRGGERREWQGESGKMGKREGGEPKETGERTSGSCMHP